MQYAEMSQKVFTAERQSTQVSGSNDTIIPNSESGESATLNKFLNQENVKNP